MMSNDVLFIDGPCRGERMAIPEDRSVVTMRHIEQVESLRGRWDVDRSRFPVRGQETHYHIHRLHERLGILMRDVRVASIHARYDDVDGPIKRNVSDVVRNMPFVLGREPSFLHEFDRWFVWASYKHRAGSRAFLNWIERGGSSWRQWRRFSGSYF